MRTKKGLVRNGRCLAITFPAQVIKDRGLRSGDPYSFELHADGTIMLRPLRRVVDLPRIVRDRPAMAAIPDRQGGIRRAL